MNDRATDDPRNQSHPAVLQITVESEETAEVSDVDQALAGDIGIVSFDTVGALLQVLTKRRVDLLQALIQIDEAVENIEELAGDLEVDPQTLREDLAVLAENELVFLIEEDELQYAFLPYEQIQLDVTIAGTDQPSQPRQGHHQSTISDSEIEALREDIRQQIDEGHDDGDSDERDWLQ